MRDLTGQRFGRYVVIGFDRVIKINGQPKNYRWWCRCDCGNVRSVFSNGLIPGVSKSCGCLMRELWGKRGTSDSRILANNVFSHYLAGAIGRGIEFSLTHEQFVELIESECYYCGAPRENTMRAHSKTYKYQGIDRVDNTGGYIVGNVVPCCRKCNWAKSKLKQEEFLEMCRKVASRFPKNGAVKKVA